MKFEEFVTSYQNPVEETGNDDIEESAEEANVVLAGTCLNIGENICRLDINGTQYEIASCDVIDIQVLSTTDSTPPDASSAEDEGSEEETTRPVPQTLLITVDKNSSLCQRVPAVLLSAMGTWMSVVPA